MIWKWLRGLLLSKTFWFNVLALVVVVASRYGYTGELPPEWEAMVPVVIALVNLILRVMTRRAVPDKRSLMD